MSVLLTKRVGERSALVTLNRPHALNSLNLELIEKLQFAFESLWNEQRLVVIRGAGNKAFCAGGDVKSMYDARRKNGSALEFFRKEYRLDHWTYSHPEKFVAVWDGIAFGGGVGISIGAGARVATERTVFAMPETRIGLFPDVGSSWFLNNVLPPRLGMYLGLTGTRLKGAEVAAAQAATHYVPSERIERLTTDLLEQGNQEALDEHTAPIPEEARDLVEELTQRVDELFAGSSLEEIYAALEEDGSDFAKRTHKTMMHMCPNAMRVTIRMLKEAPAHIADCFHWEFRLASNFAIHGSSFYEGVEALLVEKRNPRWRHDLDSNAYFESNEEAPLSLKYQ